MQLNVTSAFQFGGLCTCLVKSLASNSCQHMPVQVYHVWTIHTAKTNRVSSCDGGEAWEMYTLMYGHPNTIRRRRRRKGKGGSEPCAHSHNQGTGGWLNDMFITCREISCICACYWHISHHYISTLLQFTNFTWNYMARIENYQILNQRDSSPQSHILKMCF